MKSEIEISNRFGLRLLPLPRIRAEPRIYFLSLLYFATIPKLFCYFLLRFGVCIINVLFIIVLFEVNWLLVVQTKVLLCSAAQKLIVIKMRDREKRRRQRWQQQDQIRRERAVGGQEQTHPKLTKPNPNLPCKPPRMTSCGPDVAASLDLLFAANQILCQIPNSIFTSQTNQQFEQIAETPHREPVQ